MRETQVRLEGDYELTGLSRGYYTAKFLGGTTDAADQRYSIRGPGGVATVIALSSGGIASGSRRR